MTGAHVAPEPALCHQRRGKHRGVAFTLVELLIVIGIIGVLMALLLTGISRARMQAQRVACASNLRQIGLALIAYALDNNNSFPAQAGVENQYPEDWVYWQPDRDLRQSRLLRYLNYDAKVLECPTGITQRSTSPPYPFSYSINNKFTGSGGGHDFGVAWTVVPCKLVQVVDPSSKMLGIEEDVTAINDGQWCADDTENGLTRRTSLSVIHDRGREYGGGNFVDPLYVTRGRGNVVFADGHCDFIDRSKLFMTGFMDPTAPAGHF
jgi:prepilin-type processing-associated H-X9-DG protein